VVGFKKQIDSNVRRNEKKTKKKEVHGERNVEKEKNSRPLSPTTHI
jgi:hypothetical protein